MPKSNHAAITKAEDGINILVVEDSAEDILLLESLVGPAHTVYGVHTAQEALEYCLQQAPQCVIVDYLLPEMDGLSLAAELRKNPSMRHVPIIMWTIFGSAEIAIDARKFGVDDQISKQNITAAQLQEVIDRNYQAKFVEQARATERQVLSHENHELSRRHDLFAGYWEEQSHQLLTDLSSVQEFVSLLMDEIPGPINEEQGKCLAMARGGCAEIQRTIESIQNMTKLDQNMSKLVRQPQKLRELVDGIVAAKQVDAMAAEISLVTICELTPVVLTDGHVLCQILERILSTALNIAPPGGELCISIAQEGKQLVSVAVQVGCEEQSALHSEELQMQDLQDLMHSANAKNYRCRVLPNIGIEFSFDLSAYGQSQDKDAA